jgi:hypothetical protein
MWKALGALTASPVGPQPELTRLLHLRTVGIDEPVYFDVMRCECETTSLF